MTVTASAIAARQTAITAPGGLGSPASMKADYMKTSDLIEQRNALLGRMREAHAADKAEDFTAAESEFRSLDARIERAKALEAADRSAPGQPISGDAKLTAEIRSRFSITRALAGAAGLNVDWGFEREAQGELAKRAGAQPKGVLIPTELFEKRVITSTLPAAGPGGNIIPTDFMGGEYINALTASTVLAGLGARTLAGLHGNVDIPGEKAAPSVAWVAENSAIPAGDAQFRSVGLTPKHVGSLSELSRNMLLQSSPDIEALLRQMMARDIALEIDRAAINGGGANGPTGLLATAGVQTQAYATSIFHTSAEMIAKANTANVGARRSFLTTSAVELIGMKALTTPLMPLQMEEVFHGQRPTFSNLVPSTLNPGGNQSALIYGDWTEMLIGVWSALDVLVNPYESTAYAKGNVSVRSMATVDVALRNPQAFVKTQVPADAVAIA